MTYWLDLGHRDDRWTNVSGTLHARDLGFWTSLTPEHLLSSTSLLQLIHPASTPTPQKNTLSRDIHLVFS